MLFNSIDFAIFLPLVFSIYWIIGGQHIKRQNFFLIVASFVFYGWWAWRLLLLLIASTIIDFIAGLQIERSVTLRRKKIFLFGSIITNLGILGFFKYYNFFVENFIEAFRFLGYELDPFTLKVILPVGVSFYTFQALSYTIEIYRGHLKPTKSLLTYFAFISFFPQLVAGPIERATNMLPQFMRERHFDYEQAKDGIRQILWGLFKKIAVADTCAIYVNEIFNNYDTMPGHILLLGAIYFSFQIYGDFSGYSDIAIGTAKLFGFKLMKNFRLPYFSRDMAEFWRRWHISLTSWFRDYIYFPLGGSTGTKARTILNVMIIFLISGFWHGANWTFIAWGAINAVYFIPLLVFDLNRKNIGVVAAGKTFPSVREFFLMLFTFALAAFAWIFFRAKNIHEATDYIANMFEWRTTPLYLNRFKYLPMIFMLVSWEWVMRERDHGLDFEKARVGTRWLLYFILIWFILLLLGEEQTFIYFQF